MVPRSRRAVIAPEDRPRVRLLGLIWVAIPLSLLPLAQQWIDSAVAGMLNGATPIFTAVLATILLRTSPGRLQVAGLLVGFAGIVAIAIPSAGGQATAALGVTLAVLATLCYAIALSIVTPLQHSYGALAVLARIQWVAAVLVTPYGIYGLTQSSFAWASLLALMAAGVLGTGLALVLMGVLAGRVGATRATFITYLIPVVALILGVAFRGEVIAPMAIAGVALVIAGAVLASRAEILPIPSGGASGRSRRRAGHRPGA